MSRHERAPREGDGSGERLPAAVVADLLHDDRQRQVLACLADAEEAMAVADLARCVLARERDEAGADLDERAVAAVRDEIFGAHLPKLTATGTVTFDSLVGTVQLATDDDRLLDRLGDG